MIYSFTALTAYWYLWLAVLFFGCLFLWNPKVTLDLHLHATYFVVGVRTYALVAGCGVLLYGLVYWGMERLGYPFIPWMKTAHLAISLLWLLALVAWIRSPGGAVVERPADPQQALAAFEWRQKINFSFALSALLFAAAQVLFLINLLAALWHGNRA